MVEVPDHGDHLRRAQRLPAADERGRGIGDRDRLGRRQQAREAKEIWSRASSSSHWARWRGAGLEQTPSCVMCQASDLMRAEFQPVPLRDTCVVTVPSSPTSCTNGTGAHCTVIVLFVWTAPSPCDTVWRAVSFTYLYDCIEYTHTRVSVPFVCFLGAGEPVLSIAALVVVLPMSLAFHVTLYIDWACNSWVKEFVPVCITRKQVNNFDKCFFFFFLHFQDCWNNQIRSVH